MTYKQRIQKVLCIALAIASVSSIITPASYAQPLARAQANGGWSLAIDPAEKDYENKAPGTGSRPYENQVVGDRSGGGTPIVWLKNTPGKVCNSWPAGL